MYYTYFYEPKFNEKKDQLTFDQIFDETLALQATPHALSFRTIQIDAPTEHSKRKIKSSMQSFVKHFDDAVNALPDTSGCYTQFKIPKHSGGMRTINAPNPELSTIMQNMRLYLEGCGILPHTSAYAYVKHRTTKMAVERHCRAKHTWYLKMDLHAFFDSCTEDFVYQQLMQIPHFAILAECTDLKKYIHFWSLNNGLPQGTPISPWLTNQIMVPVDYYLANYCNQHNCIYTRYADDLIFSSNSKEFLRSLIDIVTLYFHTFTPFRINEKKTKIASVFGQNYILGLLANKDFNATIGHKKKERLRATLHNFWIDQTSWSNEARYELLGLINYYMMIEPTYFQTLIDNFNIKHHTDIIQILKPPY